MSGFPGRNKIKILSLFRTLHPYLWFGTDNKLATLRAVRGRKLSCGGIAHGRCQISCGFPLDTARIHTLCWTRLDELVHYIPGFSRECVSPTCFSGPPAMRTRPEVTGRAGCSAPMAAQAQLTRPEPCPPGFRFTRLWGKRPAAGQWPRASAAVWVCR